MSEKYRVKRFVSIAALHMYIVFYTTVVDIPPKK